jgi:hypothetical protein
VLFEGLAIHFLKQGPDAVVQLGQTEESLMAKLRQYLSIFTPIEPFRFHLNGTSEISL